MDSTKNSKKSASFHSAQNPLALMIDVCFADFSFKLFLSDSPFSSEYLRSSIVKKQNGVVTILNDRILVLCHRLPHQGTQQTASFERT